MANRALAYGPFGSISTNRHPVDELAVIRAEMKLLRQREASIRTALLADDADLIGDEYVAMVELTERSYLDRKALEACFGVDAIDACCKVVPITRLCVGLRRARKV